MSLELWTRQVKGLAERSWAITREAGASVLTYKLYPLGMVGESLPTLPVLRRSDLGGRVPILFARHFSQPEQPLPGSNRSFARAAGNIFVR